MMRSLPALAFTFLVAACGGGAKSGSPTMGRAAPTCADAAGHAHQIIADDQAGKPEGEQMATDVAGLVSERCAADGWSAETLGCIVGASTHDALHGCLETLTPEQHQKFDEAHQALHHEEHAPNTMMKGAPTPTDPCGGDE